MTDKYFKCFIFKSNFWKKIKRNVPSVWEVPDGTRYIRVFLIIDRDGTLSINTCLIYTFYFKFCDKQFIFSKKNCKKDFF